MGAAGWNYYIPYQPDMQKVLRDLQEQVFQSGSYIGPFTAEDYRELLGEKANKNLARSLPSRASLPIPQTIEELQAQCRESGTGSILDIQRVTATPERGALAPLPPYKLLEIFGTEQPAREQVDRWALRLRSVTEESLYRRNQGIYVIIYRDGLPNEIYIEGASGD
jgi:hypothetical protein